MQQHGVLSLTDPKTWDVAVYDEQGNKIDILPSSKAREIFMGTEFEKDLPKDDDNTTRSSLVNPLTSDSIDLSSSVTKDVSLSEKERLLLLQSYLEI